jgi:uncharacterized protein (DUF849 family)
MGSMNFSVHPVARRFNDGDYRFPWEARWLKGSEDFIFPNTFASIRHFLEEMRKTGTRPEFEIYDVGHLYNLDFMLSEGLVEKPIWLQFVMGVLGGIRATLYDLTHLLDTATRLFGPDGYRWSVIGAGYPQQFHMCSAGTPAWGWRTTSSCAGGCWAGTTNWSRRSCGLQGSSTGPSPRPPRCVAC